MNFVIHIILLGLTALSVHATTWYVKTNGNDTAEGTSWETAKSTIQAAINVAVSNDTIVVTNGVYSPISSTSNLPFLIRSVNGPGVTIIDGGGTNLCAKLGLQPMGLPRPPSPTNTILTGFTLRNGADYVTLIMYPGEIHVRNLEHSGGSLGGTLNNCILTDNVGGIGGGANGGTLNNCTLAGNTAAVGGGAAYCTLNNCTLIGNRARNFNGGGTYICTLNNCILWNNYIRSGTINNYDKCTFRNTCTSPLPEGDGNLSSDPLFLNAENGDFRLRSGSPCVDAGTNAFAVGTTDVNGMSRIQNGTVDMGAYEGSVSGLVIDVHIQGVGSVAPMMAISPSGGSAVFAATSQGRLFLHFMTNGVFASSSTNFTWDDITADGVLTAVFETYTWHVDATRPDDLSDGLSWGTAKRTIQSAVDASLAGDTITVTDGVYESITTDNKALTIRSVNGRDTTIIDGGGTNRCATLGSVSNYTNTTLTGFTLRNGSALCGGGSYLGTLNNCLLTSNTAGRSIFFGGFGEENGGGGSYGGVLNNCIVADNSSVSEEGGACNGILNNCTLVGNMTGFDGSSFLLVGGGSAYGNIFNNCIVWGNTIADGITLNYSSSTFRYSCTDPLPSTSQDGGGNIGSDPMFVDAANGDYRLQAGSPCINAGLNELSVGSVDLDGNPRIYNGRVDMGAYEFLMTQTTTVPVPFAWLDLFYPGLVGTNAYEVAAKGTGANARPVWESYVAGLNPTNPLSQFLANICSSNGASLVTWMPDLRPNRVYTVLGKTNITDRIWESTNAASRFFKVSVELP